MGLGKAGNLTPPQNKLFENGIFKDHLGNVRATLSDVRMSTITATGLNDFHPDVLSMTDYYAFGMIMVGRNWSADSYRYGFQGQEMDNETQGVGNAINYKYRVHDPRLGRFLSLDPLAPKYPHNSPYAFSENRVIDGVELEGLEVVLLNYGGRISIPGMFPPPTPYGPTGSISVSIAFDIQAALNKNNPLTLLATVGAGVQAGIYAGVGLSVSANFQANSTNDILGWGRSVGVETAAFAQFAGASWDASCSSFEDAVWLKDGLDGATGGVPATGPGLGFTAYYEVNYSVNLVDFILGIDDVFSQSAEETACQLRGMMPASFMIEGQEISNPLHDNLTENMVNKFLLTASQLMDEQTNEVIITPETSTCDD